MDDEGMNVAFGTVLGTRSSGTPLGRRRQEKKRGVSAEDGRRFVTSGRTVPLGLKLKRDMRDAFAAEAESRGLMFVELFELIWEQHKRAAA